MDKEKEGSKEPMSKEKKELLHKRVMEKIRTYLAENPPKKSKPMEKHPI